MIKDSTVFNMMQYRANLSKTSPYIAGRGAKEDLLALCGGDCLSRMLINDTSQRDVPTMGRGDFVVWWGIFGRSINMVPK